MTPCSVVVRSEYVLVGFALRNIPLNRVLMNLSKFLHFSYIDCIFSGLSKADVARD